ncbi:MAG: hypothetical protein ACI9AB_002302, partial [Urechidicola sp.]
MKSMELLKAIVQLVFSYSEDKKMMLKNYSLS